MKVLIIEDSADTIHPISAVFKLRWPTCTTISTTKGVKGVALAENESPDIIILEVDLPDIDGFDVLRQIRMFSEVPIVFLTERGDEKDIIRGLEGGADDYIVKPFSAPELLARAGAALRRSGLRDGIEESTPPLVSGDLTIDFQSKEVTLKGEPVHLTTTEYQILYYLMRNPGKWVNHGSLEQWIWGGQGTVDSSVIRRYIYQLRRKLNGTPPRLIVNVPGKGYKFNPAISRLSTV